MFVMLQHQIEGARVAAWTKHAAGPATPAGKPLGEAFRGACSDWRLRTRSVASAIAPA